MDDLDEVRAALGYERINIYGGSYGSNAAFVYLRQHPGRVRSLVLVGVAPVDYKMPLAWSRGVQHAMDRLFDDCAAEESCRKSFPKLREDFAEVLAKLDKAPVSFELPNPATKQMETVKLTRAAFNEHLRSLLYSPDFASALPLLIHAAAQGEFQPLGGTILEFSRTFSGPANKLAVGMSLSVICAEHLPFITQAEIAREAAGSFYGDLRVRAQIKACEQWPRGKVGPGFVTPIRSDAPVLLISGDLDPVAPQWLAAQAARYLPNSRHVIARNASHVSSSGCIDGLVAKFIAQGSAAGLDASCVEQIKRPPFLTEDMVRQIAGQGSKLDTSRGLEEWNGTLDAGDVKLRLVLRMAKNADGVWSGELISVDQGNVTLPIEAIKYQNAMMSFEVRVVGGSFEGTVKSDGTEISGQWKQGGGSAPLVFKRAVKPS
jgi:pimeloyl-ACP methyl ester carboxylesterase